MPLNWEITKLHRREGEAITKARLPVPCKLKTSAWFSGDSQVLSSPNKESSGQGRPCAPTTRLAFSSLKDSYHIRKVYGICGLRAGRPRGRSSSPGWGKNFQFSMSSRPALRPTQSPIQSVTGALSPWVKRPGREADHSPPTSAEVK
jgi:hypothetical protein